MRINCFFFFVLFAVIFLPACRQGGESRPAAMPELLRQKAAEAFFVPANEYASSVRVEYYDSLLRLAPPGQQDKYKLQKALNLLYGGKTPEAIELLEDLYRKKNSSRFLSALEPHEEESLESWLALAYLRLGEQENCLDNHTSASCIVPIQAAGYHQKTTGSEKAIQLYQRILENDSHDYSSRWLLNVAYMTLGRYPQDVPEKWLIPPAAFASEYPLKRFTDVLPQTGLSDNNLAGGGITEDFDNDGALDLLVTSWFAGDQVRLFRNNRDGTFTEKTAVAGLTGITGGLNAVQADYNNDGHTDVLILRGAWLEKLGGHPNSLLRNNGDGTFTDVTREAGLLSFHPTQTATWNDFNLDGRLDLFVGNESSGPGNVHPCELFLNNGDGTFREAAREAGVGVSRENGGWWYVKGVTSGDVNGDGRPDLYVSALDDRNRNLLFLNKKNSPAGTPVFEDVTEAAGLGENLSSFPTWFWDYDNDGRLDLFVAGFRRSNPWESITKDVAAEYLGQPHNAETARLYRNRGDGTFENVSERVGLNRITYAMGANFGDFDNDGFLDMYLGTGEVNFASIIPNRAFRNAGGERFQDVTTAGGFGHLQKGHAVSFADLDNDGDQDVHVVLGGAYEGDVYQDALFQNPYQDDNAWITLKLTGRATNRSAIGAKVKLVITEKGKRREIHREVNSGGSFGCNPLRLQVGLGKAARVDELEITWPVSGQKQQFRDIAARQFIGITEGREEIKPMPLQSFRLGNGTGHAAHHVGAVGSRQ